MVDGVGWSGLVLREGPLVQDLEVSWGVTMVGRDRGGGQTNDVGTLPYASVP